MKQCKKMMPGSKAIHKRRVKDCLAVGITHMGIATANLEGHTCSVASALKDKRIPIEELRELPLAGCDAESCGCFCYAVVDPPTEQQLREINQDPRFRVTVRGFGRLADIDEPMTKETPPSLPVKESEPTSASAGIIISLAVLGLAVIIIASNNDSPNGLKFSSEPLPGTPGVAKVSVTSSPRLSADERALINDWESKGYLRIDAEWHKAYVSSVLWLNIDAQRKETLVSLLATDGAEKRGHDLRNIELFDKQSGHKIASYSIWTGVKLE